MAEEQQPRHTFRDVAGVSALRACAFLPHRVALALGAAMGRVACVAMLRKRNRVVENLRRAGIKDARRAYWAAGSHIGRTVVEMGWLLFHSPERARALMRIEGLDVVREAVAEGKGVLLTGGHLGNWELTAQAAALAGAPVVAVARGQGTPRVEARIAAFRERGGVTTLVRGVGGTSIAARRTLHDGAVLACMMDRTGMGRRLEVPFLGSFMKLPVGPVVLARRAGSPIVVGGARRLADGTSLITFRRLEVPPGRQSVDDIVTLIAHELERLIAEAPEQWYWIYRRRPRPRLRRKAEGESASAGSEGADVTAARPQRVSP